MFYDNIIQINKEIFKLRAQLLYYSFKFKYLNTIIIVIYTILCIISVINLFESKCINTYIFLIVYYISLSCKPELMCNWKNNKKQKWLYQLFWITFLVMLLVLNINVGISIGKKVFGSDPLVGFIFASLTLCELSFICYCGDVYMLYIDLYIELLITNSDQNVVLHDKSFHRFDTVNNLNEFIKIRYNNFIQAIKILLIILIILFKTLELTQNSLYIYFEFLDKAIILSLAFDSIVRNSFVEYYNKKINDIKNKLSMISLKD